jgi:hypothetical protein
VAKVGKLRHRDGRLVVEGMSGEIVAEIEPDDNMRIDTTGLISAMLVKDATPPGFELEGAVSVTWYQTIGDPGGYIDADAIDVQAREIEAPRPELESGD